CGDKTNSEDTNKENQVTEPTNTVKLITEKTVCNTPGSEDNEATELIKKNGYYALALQPNGNIANAKTAYDFKDKQLFDVTPEDTKSKSTLKIYKVVDGVYFVKINDVFQRWDAAGGSITNLCIWDYNSKGSSEDVVVYREWEANLLRYYTIDVFNPDDKEFINIYTSQVKDQFDYDGERIYINGREVIYNGDGDRSIMFSINDTPSFNTHN
ncbi:MAG: hypothetical protein II399_05185, partial [Lachnospiraceae bacterium]|nr:hypothetical protein [Lachnospiraceae bacterium]